MSQRTGSAAPPLCPPPNRSQTGERRVTSQTNGKIREQGQVFLPVYVPLSLTIAHTLSDLLSSAEWELGKHYEDDRLK